MKNIISIILGIIFILTSNKIYSQTAEEIVDEYIKATGGADNWNSINTLKTQGNASMSTFEFPVTVSIMKPDKVQVEIFVQGQKIVQATDGITGWSINPMTGSNKPEIMDENEAKRIKKQGNIGGDIINYKTNGMKIELIGEDILNDKNVFVVKGIHNDGDTSIYSFDKESKLLLKTESNIQIQGMKTKSSTFYDNFKEVGGIKIPFFIETKAPGMPGGGQKIIIEKAEVNIELSDSIFKMPDNK